MKNVLLLGRTNVGKSSLFNILSRKKLAIVADERNVTRDNLKNVIQVYSPDKKYSHQCQIIDSGGWHLEKSDIFNEVRNKLVNILKSIDLVIIVFNVLEVTSEDQEIVNFIRKFKKTNIIYIANKADSEKQEFGISDIYHLGCNKVLCISCTTFRNLSALRLMIYEKLFKSEAQFVNEDKQVDDILEQDKKSFNLAVIGKPNVGKSYLFNKLISEKRAIVSEIAGTTRDAIEDSFVYKNKYLIKIVDTAGIRKKNREKELVEELSIKRSINAIRNANICILLIDATQSLSTQDKKLTSIILKEKKAFLVVFNKMDNLSRIEKENYESNFRRIFPHISHIPVILISAKTGQNIPFLLKSIVQIWENYNCKLSTSEINQFIKKILNSFNILYKETRFKIYYGLQINNCPPHIRLYINAKRHLKTDIEKYLFRSLLKHTGWKGFSPNFQYIEKQEKSLRNTSIDKKLR